MTYEPNKTTNSEMKNYGKSLVPLRQIHFKKFVVKPHNYLYSLVPIGIGTSSVESLISYVSRLALSHSITVGNLYRDELSIRLAPQVEKKNYLTNFYQHVHAVNGLTKYATNWVTLIETLTLQNNLRYLTMLPWQHILSNRTLLKNTRSWCTYCFTESKNNGEVIYEQLFWNLEGVTYCIKHQTKLSARCVFCEKESYILTFKSRPGHCYHCDEWLGSNIPAINQENNKEIKLDSGSIYSSNILLSLVNLAKKYPHEGERECFAKNLLNCVERLAGGNLRAFAKTLSEGRTTLFNLCNQQVSLRIELLIKLCRITNISVEDLLFNDVKQKTLPEAIIQPRKTKEDIISHLKSFLLEFDNPSLLEIAKRIGIHRDTLYEIDSELCRRITAKNQINNPRKREFIKKHSLDEIEEALKIALKTNPPVTLQSVAEKLGYASGSLVRQRSPKLAKKVVDRKNKYFKNKYHKIEKSMIAALKESPPPSLTAFSQRMGYKNASRVRQISPTLSLRISERFLKYKERHEIYLSALQTALKTEPPESINSIAKALKVPRSRLYATDSQLCRTISQRYSNFVKGRL